MLILGVIALLLFGSRLPEVARSLGKSLTEFKRGLKGVQDEFTSAVDVRSTMATTTSKPRPPRKRPDPVDDDKQHWQAPRFELPKSEPQAPGDAPASPA
jgi:sec-independent protein translocase protein TatA